MNADWTGWFILLVLKVIKAIEPGRGGKILAAKMREKSAKIRESKKQKLSAIEELSKSLLLRFLSLFAAEKCGE